ncbi:MAG: hypothetical protein IKP45_08460 [Bacteroidales bacterium]|nr:hypothetical protein [Bacteroidales bacterium]
MTNVKKFDEFVKTNIENDKIINESRSGECVEYRGHIIHIECYYMDNESDYAFIKQNIDVIWNILQDGYRDMGGYKGLESKRDLLKKSTMVKLGFYDSEIIAVDIFNGYLGGNKSVGITCYKDINHDAGKLLVEMIIEENIKRWDEWIWAEVSGKIEHYYKKYGGLSVSDKYIPIYLPSITYKLEGDGFHYHRRFKSDDENTLTEKEKEDRCKMIMGVKDEETYEILKEDAYAPLIEFLKSINVEKLDESNAFGRYFAKKSRVEQAKIIVDKYVEYINDEEMYEFPKEYYDVFVENILLLEDALKSGGIPLSLRKVYLEECIERGRDALKKISILKPLVL